MATTDFYKRCEILSDLWLEYKSDENMRDFIMSCPAGFAIAYLVDQCGVDVDSDKAKYVDETFGLLCYLLDLDIDQEYNSVDEMIAVPSAG